MAGRVLAFMAIGIACWAGGGGSAHAAGGSSTLTITGGAGLSLFAPAAGLLVPAQPSTASRTYYLALPDLQVTDSRGTGAGWHITVQAAATRTDGTVLPAGAISLLSPRARCVATISCRGRAAPPESALAARATRFEASAPLTVVSARQGTGMGSFRITFGTRGHGLAVLAPPVAVPVDYSVRLIFAVAPGP